MALTKDQIIHQVNYHCGRFGIFTRDFAVGYGAALVLHGIRKETNDIDVDVPLDLYNSFAEGFERGQGLTGEYIRLSDVVDIHVGDIEKDVVVIEGISVYSLPRLYDAYVDFMKNPNRNSEKRKQDKAVVHELLTRATLAVYNVMRNK